RPSLNFRLAASSTASVALVISGPIPSPGSTSRFTIVWILYTAAHVPRAPLPRRARAARQLPLPAGLRAGAPVVYAEDAQPAEPRRVRPARVGSGEQRPRAALLLLLAAAAGVRPQPEAPCRENPGRVPARPRPRRGLSHARRDLAAELPPVPFQQGAAGAGAQRRPRAFRRDEAATGRRNKAGIPLADSRHHRQRMGLRPDRVAAPGPLSTRG